MKLSSSGPRVGSVAAPIGAITKARGGIAEWRIDALVASSAPNVCYTSGTYFPTQISLPERLALVVVFPQSEPVFIYCTIEEGHAKAESWLKSLHGYTEFADRPIDVLASVLTENGAAAGRIGVESKHLSARDYGHLIEALPHAEFVPADELFDAMRAVKTPAEVRILGDAATSTDAAIRAAFGVAKLGSTTLDIADIQVSECRARGGQRFNFITMATGSDNFKVHAPPSSTRLAAGGVLRTDFGMTWTNYLSDIARTAFVGPLAHYQRDTYLILEEVHQIAIAAMKPGLRASRIYEICVEAFAQRNIKLAMPHVGHSIGLGLHENPMFHPFDHTELEVGMVFMLEPLIMARDGCYHTEDMIVITPNGSDVLSRSANWSEPMVLT